MNADSVCRKKAPVLRSTAMEGRQKAQKIFNHKERKDRKEKSL